MFKTRTKVILLLALLPVLFLIGLKLWLYLQQKPRTLTVPDKYKSIQSAIDKARPEDTVFIKAGIYNEPHQIKLKDGVRLIGEAMDKVSVRAQDTKAPCVISVHDCNNALIQGITVEFVATSEKPSSQKGVDIKKSSVIIDQCRIRSMPREGLSAARKSNLLLKNCILEANSADGLIVFGKGTTAVIEQSIFTKNGQCGIRFFFLSAGSVLQSLFEGNKKTGIAVTNGCEPVTVRQNACVLNGANGIYFGEVERALVENNELVGNLQVGIYINGTPDTRVSGNRCVSNASHGICLDKGATGYVRDNICQENRDSGIYALGDKTNVKVSKNNCRQNVEHGIVFYKCARGTVENNICRNNELTGIYMTETGKDVVVTENWCEKNEDAGIFFSAVSGTIAKSNISSSNKDHGILFQKKSSAVAENNNFYSNSWSGICAIGEGTNVRLTDNQCDDNYPSGILFTHGATGIIENNLCQGSPWSGIAIRGSGTNPSVISNTCKRNGAWGIVTWAGAEPDIAGNNTTLGNGRGGIKLDHQVEFGLYSMLLN
jgi:parallel beta-helix repeat protein